MAKTGRELTKVARNGRSRSVYGQKGWKVVLANHVSLFPAFIFLPTRYWPSIDQELPFLAVAL